MKRTCALIAITIASLLTVPTLALAADAPAPAPAPAVAGAEPVAVIDLDQAARELGYAATLETSLGDCRKQLQADVKRFADAYEGQVQSVARSMVPKDAKPSEHYTLSPEQTTEMNRDVAAIRQQVAQLGQKADQMFNAYRAEWVRHYREALMPIVREVARSRQASVVLVKTDALLYAEPTTDITAVVVAAAKANPPQVAPVAMPHLEAPAEANLPSAPATQPAKP